MAKESSLKWWILVTVIVGTFLGRLDQTIVNLALPTIIQDFNISVSAAGWIATAYIIANAVFVPVWGKLGDMVGRKKVYIWGFTFFIFGSILAGLSWNLSSMILFRIIQAVAGSADYPTAMAILAVTFREGKERAQALGIWSASFASAVVFGPLIGGPLIDLFGWRSVFLINLPVGLLGLFMAIVFIEESSSEKKVFKFDWMGAVLLGISLSALVLVLDQGMDWGWTSGKSMISYCVIILFSGLFYRNEKNHKEPIVDFKFFKNPIFTGTLINNFIIFMGLMGAVFMIPLFAQTFLGYDATTTGYLYIPMAIFLMIFAPIGGRLTGKVSAKIVVFVSTLVAAAGLFLFAYLLDVKSTALDIIIPLSILAAGMGFGMSQRTNLIASSVPKEEIGIASSILALARNIAGAFGIAVFATILNSAVKTNVLNFARDSIVNVKTPLILKEVTALIILKSEVSAYVTVFFVAAVLVLLGTIYTLFMKFPKHESDVKVHAE